MLHDPELARQARQRRSALLPDRNRLASLATIFCLLIAALGTALIPGRALATLACSAF